MKFIIQRSKDNQFYYVLIARNGKVVMASETYKRKASCIKSILSMIKQVAVAKVVDKNA